MSREFPVTGLNDVLAVITAMGGRLETAGFRQALTAAAKPITMEARERAPKKSGRMAKGIKTGSPRKNQDGTYSIQISAGGQDGYLALFHEFGTLPHPIARTGPKEGRVALRKAAAGDGEVKGGVMKIGDDFVSGIITHPGERERPFMRPALDAKAEEAVAAFGNKLKAFVEAKSGYAVPETEDEAA